MVKTNDLKEMLFKVGLYNVSKLDDFDFKFSDHKEYLMHILKLEYDARTKHSLEDYYNNKSADASPHHIISLV